MQIRTIVLTFPFGELLVVGVTNDSDPFSQLGNVFLAFAIQQFIMGGGGL
jgi:hypothetical protein